MGIGKRQMGELHNHLFGKTPDTTPAGVLYVSLHTASPGEDGQTSNEATGTGYARKSTAASDWSAATNADPTVTKTGVAITFAAAGGSWSSGATFTHFGLWAHASSTTEANFVGWGTLSVGKVVASGDIPSFAIDALTMSSESIT